MLNIRWFPDWKIGQETRDSITYKNINTGYEQKIYKCIPKEVKEKVDNKFHMLSFNIEGFLSSDGKYIMIPKEALSDATLYF